MADAHAAANRKRAAYNKKICLGCRKRRIRCTLPDPNILPSPRPQASNKACQRCAQNGLDCIVDYTTLGRPAQKRTRAENAWSNHSTIEQPIVRRSTSSFQESISDDVEVFLLSHPETADDEPVVDNVRNVLPTRSETLQACFGPFHLLPALLARDKQFAASIGSQPDVADNVMDLVHADAAMVLDDHLAWHRLHFPDIPSLVLLREQVQTMEPGQLHWPTYLFLLTLLCDLALDVPSARLEQYQAVQPAVRALLYHAGQQVLFSISRHRYTVLGLLLVAEYRPTALTSSKLAAAPAVRAIPYILIAKQVAVELGYDTAGARLTEALHGFESSQDFLNGLIQQCLHWTRLSAAHESMSSGVVEDRLHFRTCDETTLECVEALNTASLVGRMPADMLLAYTTTAGSVQMLLVLADISENWRDLGRLGEIVQSHRGHCDRDRETLESTLAASVCSPEQSAAISHLAEAARHLSRSSIVGCALFFAVMYGAHAAKSQHAVGPDQAMELSDNIIDQLKPQYGGDSEKPSHRKFLEDFGHTRMDELEQDLANFITAAESLSLDGVPFVGPTRSFVVYILFICKDIVEGQAARLKGWGGLHERIDMHMILFLEVARRLEAMSATAGTEEAMSKGCILTGTAKLVRSLHRILQGFKRTVVLNQRRSASESSKQSITPSSGSADADVAMNSAALLASGWDDNAPDDVFADWNNWPQFDASNFSDLFGDAFSWDPNAM